MILVFMRDTHAIPRCFLFCIVQLINLAYLIKTKPFENTKDNVIEIMNECIFWCLAVFLSIFQYEIMWGEGMASIIIMIVMCNGFLISFVLITSSVVELVQWYKARANKNKVIVLRNIKLPVESLDENINVNNVKNE